MPLHLLRRRSIFRKPAQHFLHKVQEKLLVFVRDAFGNRIPEIPLARYRVFTHKIPYSPLVSCASKKSAFSTRAHRHPRKTDRHRNRQRCCTFSLRDYEPQGSISNAACFSRGRPALSAPVRVGRSFRPGDTERYTSDPRGGSSGTALDLREDPTPKTIGMSALTRGLSRTSTVMMRTMMPKFQISALYDHPVPRRTSGAWQ